MVPCQKVTANYVPAAAVIRRWQALSGMIGRKGCAGGLLSPAVKDTGSTCIGAGYWKAGG